MAKKKTNKKAAKKAKTGRVARKSENAKKAKTVKRRRTKTEIQPMDATAATLIPRTKQNSLTTWFNLYMGIEAGEPDSNTFKAKRDDLSRFINYFQKVTGSDHPDQWTRSISQGFVKHLLRTKSERTGKTLAPTTVNRVLATLRNTAKWIQQQRPFLAGYPLDRIPAVTTSEPEWKGLSDVDVTRLKSAAEQLVHINTRHDQTAARDHALLLVMLDTACRVSEIVNLDLEQYQGKHFHRVKRKGNNVTEQIFIGQAARDVLNNYLEEHRGMNEGPLFQSRNGKRLAPQNVADALKKIVAQANARLSKKEHIQLTPHVLRHTALRKMAEKKGIRFAQQMAGHASSKYIWRYVQPSRADIEDAVEDLFE